MEEGHLGAGLPPSLPDELVTTLVSAPGVRVERIVSHGQATPPGSWYDQDEDEFVLLVEGQARLLVEGEAERSLRPGDWLDIPAHVRHRVTWTDPDRRTIWLAVFHGSRIDPCAR